MVARRFSMEEDIRLLWEVVRQRPFHAPKNKVHSAWNDVAAAFNAGAKNADDGHVDVQGLLLRRRFDSILTLRREELRIGLTNKFFNATNNQRQRLLDACISLLDNREVDVRELERELEREQEAAAAPPVTVMAPKSTAKRVKRVKRSRKAKASPTSDKPMWRAFSAQEFVFMLRELLQQPPMSNEPTDFRLACANIAAKMRADPSFERPEVRDRSVYQALLRLINRRRQQLKSNSIACFTDDVDCNERDLLTDRWIQLEDALEKEQRFSLPAPANGLMSLTTGSTGTQPPDSEAEAAMATNNRVDDDKESVHMLRLRLEAERRVREHALRVEEELHAREVRATKSWLRQTELAILRLEREAEQEVHVEIAKAVAEGISTGVAAILGMVSAANTLDTQTV
ncbi:hypothetical protein PINS_up012454 [Pythium insidiosum]|nr:hypothetical protein PINS_up012454 [Pythium insidiosum]